MAGYVIAATSSQSKPASPRPRKIAVIWAKFGAYHIARTNALAQLADVVPIQFSRYQDYYGWPAEHSAGGAEIVTLSESDLGQIQWPSACRAVWKTLSRGQPDVVLVPGYSDPISLTAATWARVHRRISVLMSESKRDDYSRSFCREWMKRIVVRVFYTRALVGGKAAREYVRELGVPDHRIGVGYDVVDNRFFREAAQRIRKTESHALYGFPPDYFLYVGRLAPEKNLQTLISAYAEYRNEGGQWSLMLVGSGAEEPTLRSQVAELGIAAHVQFEGFKTTWQLPPYYAFASCFVLPSRKEPWGLVVNEAMASGVPVIVSSRCGSAHDLVIDGANGFTFDPQNPGELKNRMVQLGGLSQDQLLEMRRQSQRIINAFSPATFATEVMRVSRV